MSDDPIETITSMEAKAFCLRYGLKHISELENIAEIETQNNQLSTTNNIEKIARELGEKNQEIEKFIANASRKLNSKKALLKP